MENRQDHLHWELDAGPRDTLQITVDQMATVLLMDEANYRKYCEGQQHSAYGGMVEKPGPQILKPYRPGRWHIVVDMGRSGGQVSASVSNRTTGQPIGTPQARRLRGAQAGTLEHRVDES
jgi:hypothetical protein